MSPLDGHFLRFGGRSFGQRELGQRRDAHWNRQRGERKTTIFYGTILTWSESGPVWASTRDTLSSRFGPLSGSEARR